MVLHIIIYKENYIFHKLLLIIKTKLGIIMIVRYKVTVKSAKKCNKKSHKKIFLENMKKYVDKVK